LQYETPTLYSAVQRYAEEVTPEKRGFEMIEVAAITGYKTLTMLKRYTHLKVEDLLLKLG